MEILKINYFMVTSKLDNHSPALTKAAGKEEYCVTVSQHEELVTFKDWFARPISGRDLINTIPFNVGILIAEKDGGRYIFPETIADLKNQ